MNLSWGCQAFVPLLGATQTHMTYNLTYSSTLEIFPTRNNEQHQ
jgi:hypothetical protein